MIRKLRSGLVIVILLAITVRIVWWTIEPLIPYVVGALVSVCILGFIYHRVTRW